MNPPGAGGNPNFRTTSYLLQTRIHRLRSLEIGICRLPPTHHRLSTRPALEPQSLESFLIHEKSCLRYTPSPKKAQSRNTLFQHIKPRVPALLAAQDHE